MKFLTALLVLASANSAFALGRNDSSRIDAQLNEVKSLYKVCTLSGDMSPDSASHRTLNLLCGETEESAKVVAAITYEIGNPGSRCEDWTATAMGMVD